MRDAGHGGLMRVVMAAAPRLAPCHSRLITMPGRNH